MSNYGPEDLSQKDSELDMKTALLFQEVESVLKHYEEQQQSTDDDVKTINGMDGEVNSDRSIDSSKEWQKSSTINILQSSSIPKTPHVHHSRDTMLANNEPELKFLRAKVKILTSEISRQQADYRRKMEEWKAHENDVQTLKQENSKQTHLITGLNQELNKLTVRLTERSHKLQKIEAENTKLLSELQVAKKESRLANQRATTLELRLNRLTEEMENHKTALLNSQVQDKEGREEQRRILEQQVTCVQRAERQRNDLALAFRRQMLLCHNLQQQKDLLVAGAALKEAEVKFDTLLM